jgi:hypothetical protein
MYRQRGSLPGTQEGLTRSEGDLGSRSRSSAVEELELGNQRRGSGDWQWRIGGDGGYTEAHLGQRLSLGADRHLADLEETHPHLSVDLGVSIDETVSVQYRRVRGKTWDARKSLQEALAVVHRPSRLLPQRLERVVEGVLLLLLLPILLESHLGRSEIVHRCEDGERQEEGLGESALDELGRVVPHDAEEVADEREDVLDGIEEEEGVECGDTDGRVVAIAEERTSVGGIEEVGDEDVPSVAEECHAILGDETRHRELDFPLETGQHQRMIPGSEDSDSPRCQRR